MNYSSLSSTVLDFAEEKGASGDKFDELAQMIFTGGVLSLEDPVDLKLLSSGRGLHWGQVANERDQVRDERELS